MSSFVGFFFVILVDILSWNSSSSSSSLVKLSSKSSAHEEEEEKRVRAKSDSGIGKQPPRKKKKLTELPTVKEKKRKVQKKNESSSDSSSDIDIMEDDTLKGVIELPKSETVDHINKIRQECESKFICQMRAPIKKFKEPTDNIKVRDVDTSFERGLYRQFLEQEANDQNLI